MAASPDDRTFGDYLNGPEVLKRSLAEALGAGRSRRRPGRPRRVEPFGTRKAYMLFSRGQS